MYLDRPFDRCCFSPALSISLVRCESFDGWDERANRQVFINKNKILLLFPCHKSQPNETAVTKPSRCSATQMFGQRALKSSASFPPPVISVFPSPCVVNSFFFPSRSHKLTGVKRQSPGTLQSHSNLSRLLGARPKLKMAVAVHCSSACRF